MMAKKYTVPSFLLALLLVMNPVAGEQEIYFDETFEFYGQDYETRVITAYNDKFNRTNGLEFVFSDVDGYDNFTLAVIYNESTPVYPDYTSYYEDADIKFHYVYSLKNVLELNISSTILYPFSDKGHLNNTIENTDTDHPNKFRIILYHEGNEYGRISILMRFINTDSIIWPGYDLAGDDGNKKVVYQSSVLGLGLVLLLSIRKLKVRNNI